MTKLEALNFFVLQWFFVRRMRVGHYERDNTVGRGEIPEEIFVQTGWSWMTGVLPMTGWGNDYVYLKDIDWWKVGGLLLIMMSAALMLVTVCLVCAVVFR